MFKKQIIVDSSSFDIHVNKTIECVMKKTAGNFPASDGAGAFDQPLIQ